MKKKRKEEKKMIDEKKPCCPVLSVEKIVYCRKEQCALWDGTRCIIPPPTSEAPDIIFY